MAQQFFSTLTTPSLVNLDANFSELYDLLINVFASGDNLGLGVTPSDWSSSYPSLQVKNAAMSGSGLPDAAFFSANTFASGSTYNNGTYISAGYASYYRQYLGAHAWFTAPSGAAGNPITFTQAMTLDNAGNFLIGKTATGASNSNSVGLESGTVSVCHVTGTSSGTTYNYFGYAASIIGSITQNGTSGVLYNTSSDYRLKLNPQPIAGSGAFIDALKPCSWTWKLDGTPGAGFVAHEFAEVSPSSVSGEKDAVDAEGKPVYQSMQASSAEVMAHIVAELQSLRQRVAALEARA